MDLDGTIFWYFGGALVLAALVISFIGIKGKENFPPSGAAMWGVIGVFAVLVVGSAAYGVANAAEEKEHRDQELAEAEEEAAGEEAAESDSAPGGQPSGETPTEPGAAPGGEQAPGDKGNPQVVGGAAQTFDITSPSDGSLAFEPDSAQANAGTITLAYSNPSPVSHNIAIEDDQAQVLAESDTVTNADTEATADLAPGEYIFFCTIPGHREGGMEGVLTVL